MIDNSPANTPASDAGRIAALERLPRQANHASSTRPGWAVACAVLSLAAAANPHAPTVVHGTAAFSGSGTRLDVQASDRAILNWQQFSIGTGEHTHFALPDPASAVLNRVVGSDPSAILGRLSSNGHVVLVNPHGIAFGAEAVVDTAGLIASTLGISDRDFLDGRWAFAEGPEGAAPLSNAGLIRTDAGGVFLIAPRIENSGLIETEDGDLLLAAGRRVTLTGLDLAGIRLEVAAPDDAVINLGALIARGGSAGLAGAMLRNAGLIEATGLGQDAQGNIVLQAAADIELAPGSLTRASREVHIESASAVVESGAGAGANASDEPASVWLGGSVRAANERTGGTIRVAGARIAVLDTARIDASGPEGGGQVLLGGARGGKPLPGHGPDRSAAMTDQLVVLSGASIRADASERGDGGEIVLWSQRFTAVHGQLIARGGTGGRGGFVETSGRVGLQVSVAPDVSARSGLGGEWLIDPLDLSIVAGSGSVNVTPAAPFPAAGTVAASGTPATIGVTQIATALSGGASITIETGAAGAATGRIDWQPDARLDVATTTGRNTLTLRAHSGIDLRGQVVDDASGGASLDLVLDGDLDGDGTGRVRITGNVQLHASNLTTRGQGTELSGGGQIAVHGGTWTDTSGSLDVGRGSAGTALVSNGALQTLDGGVGVLAGGLGTLTLDASSWRNAGGRNSFGVGVDGGHGTLNLQNGSVARIEQTTDGIGGRLDVGKGTAGGFGTVNVRGSGTVLLMTGGGVVPGSEENSVKLGREAGTTGVMNISDGARVETLSFEVARDGTGTAVISRGGLVRAVNDSGGVRSIFVPPFDAFGGFVRAGRNAGSNGTIIVEDGGGIEVVNIPGKTAPELQIARGAGSTGRVIVRGEGSFINVDQGPTPVIDQAGPLVNLRAGDATLIVTDRGQLNMSGDDWLFNIGRDTNASGRVEVSHGGQINVRGARGAVNIARDAGSTGVLAVTDGGRMTITGAPTPVPGAGSGMLYVGVAGSGSLQVTDGGALHNAANGLTVVARERGSQGRVTVQGSGALLNVGAGLLTGEDFDPASNRSLGPGSGGTATLQVLEQGTIVTQGQLSVQDIAGGIQALRGSHDARRARLQTPLASDDEDETTSASTEDEPRASNR
ncbi:MAG: filamentous hemagglutinin N-terminal domain-containing protein [Gammaproteobacteria bacterium]|nr:filamentous hemagglutinin N-terminal domain-containing protein [Gammaproteobacteria bacterium]